jgi:hypothetical protein
MSHGTTDKKEKKEKKIVLFDDDVVRCMFVFGGVG